MPVDTTTTGTTGVTTVAGVTVTGVTTGWPREFVEVLRETTGVTIAGVGGVLVGVIVTAVTVT